MKKLNRRNFLKNGIRLMFYSVLTSGLGYYYARYIEPRLLTTAYHTISSPLIPRGFNGAKIVQFSDLHLGYNYTLEQLEVLIEKINEQKPDLVFFTGDLMDDQRTYSRTNEIAPVLRRVNAPLGKFAIYGNHDHGGYGTEIYEQIMSAAGYEILINSSKIIKLVDGSQIGVLGIDDLMLGNPKIKETIQQADPNLYTIALIHEPDMAHMVADSAVNLQLSGHSHGGQVQIPFVGPIITPPLAEKYVEGFYKVNSSSGHELLVYVNRGIGTTRVPFRFLARPELTVFTLVAK
ncbi:metallophosphoesterase [Bacillus sp. 165]|uniref:metallophosphoesterase n=1 Tax=Bacillus sp. 165 TaxID=1529117 RepID=UPI001ADA38FF|nr:metallophosphoesterase [Bacillus sp. 165]MBO9130359.1 metallophosphoesterase [Bacillus sp. 165]